MAKLPKSVKIKRNGVEYISNVERVQYTLHELIRAALRDVGKLITKRARQNMDKAGIKRHKGRMKKNTQYWVRRKQKTPNLQVGYKPAGFYAGFYELGSSKHKKHGMLQNAVKDNMEDIQDIQAQYLSAIEDERKAINLIDDNEYQGG
ncbi:HK97-gp10 family putative phage morphogenesis protein [Abyssisolibacter fermentans]|uniref:HK97-gp10 family putative phage morphogenesis protein n=1 Tax=Abyssisolibacter fermentans TaxID=1766203 RepID=UPI000833B3A6|nr:HK97-gp10 family putative phage morphogenesis protein [Abyssisolibacter fermentans]